MKKYFYTGLIGLTVFEILKVYFIMPMPGSQRMDSLDIAYFLHSYRWYFRILFGVLIIVGARDAFGIKWKWVPALALVPAFVAGYFFNFKMNADSMFKEPKNLVFKSQQENTLMDSSVVVGVEFNGQAKAYPIRFLTYHHQVRDTVGGKAIMVTYCSVCRNGRVYEPKVRGVQENFRLVGMDHFNAMFEDASTKSWWRQATGEAVTGPLKGDQLPEVESSQMVLRKWFELYPDAQVMQMDDASKSNYDSLRRFERGKSKNELTRTDTTSWNDKSWVVGIDLNGVSKAYDWNEMKARRIINDKVGETPVVLVLASDNQSFSVFERNSEAETFSIQNDTLVSKDGRFDFSGRDVTKTTQRLKKVKAYQEFWHSWKTFHPGTQQHQ